MAIDPKHLPEDPQVLQRMVLDLMAQLDRESAERTNIQNLLRELLDAKRTRKSEQLSEDQLALFAAAWEARQTAAEASRTDDQDGDGPGAQPAAGAKAPPNKSGAGSPWRGTSSASAWCMTWRTRKSIALPASRTCGPSGKSPASAMSTFPPNC
ncbi:MAG TPA: hypothetical protein VN924_25325, partial [Bryobacteraceae bacterium]|nr:hypothetical protein [Bryobacteraceae bacterium]